MFLNPRPDPLSQALEGMDFWPDIWPHYAVFHPRCDSMFFDASSIQKRAVVSFDK